MEAGNLVEKLHAVEQERNILVEFIEADMEKSASISKDTADNLDLPHRRPAATTLNR